MKFIEVVDSTQKYIKKSNYDVVVSKIQTLGYGVSGRWDSNNENLYFSKRCEFSSRLWVTVIVSIYQLCKEYSKDVYIKIPNDIYIKDKKLAGFIIEHENFAFVGIGLNIFEPFSSSRVGLGYYDKTINIKDLALKLNEIIDRNLARKPSGVYDEFKCGTTIIGTELEFIYKKTTLKKKVINLMDDKIYFEDFSCYFNQIKLLKWKML